MRTASVMLNTTPRFGRYYPMLAYEDVRKIAQEDINKFSIKGAIEALERLTEARNRPEENADTLNTWIAGIEAKLLDMLVSTRLLLPKDVARLNAIIQDDSLSNIQWNPNAIEDACRQLDESLHLEKVFGYADILQRLQHYHAPVKVWKAILALLPRLEGTER